MTLTEFRKHHDAFFDAKSDIDWPRLMTLLDQGDLLGAGQHLDHHFNECKEALAEEIEASRGKQTEEEIERAAFDATEARAINESTRTY